MPCPLVVGLSRSSQPTNLTGHIIPPHPTPHPSPLRPMIYLVNLNQEQFVKKRSKWLPKIQVSVAD